MKSGLNPFKQSDPQERRLVISRFLQRVGGEASYFVGILGYAAYDLHASAALIALIMFSLNAAQMLGSVVAGFFIDRFGPRKVLLVSQFGFLIASIGVQFTGKSIVAFIVFSFILGFLFAHFTTGFSSFAPYIVKGTDDLRRVNSLVEIASYLATIIGPLIGAAIVVRFPTIRVFLFTGVMTVFSLIYMWRFTERYQPEQKDEVKHPLHEIKRGFQLTFKESILIFFLVANVLLFFAFGAFDSLESLYYKDVVGVGVEWMGYVNAAIGAGLLVGAFVLSRLSARRITIQTLAYLMLAMGIGTFIYVATKSVFFVLMGGLILGFAFGAAEPLMRTLIQAVSPMQYVGRIMGAMHLVRSAGTLIPLLLAPMLSEYFGVQGVLVGASLLTVAVAVVLLPRARSLDLETAGTIHIDHIDPFADGEETAIRRETEPLLGGEGGDLHEALRELEESKTDEGVKDR